MVTERDLNVLVEGKRKATYLNTNGKGQVLVQNIGKSFIPVFSFEGCAPIEHFIQ